jgi:hypothetical protein
MPLTPVERQLLTSTLSEWNNIAEQNTKRSKALEVIVTCGMDEGWEHAESQRCEGKAAGYHGAMTSMQAVIKLISINPDEITK